MGKIRMHRRASARAYAGFALAAALLCAGCLPVLSGCGSGLGSGGSQTSSSVEASSALPVSSEVLAETSFGPESGPGRREIPHGEFALDMLYSSEQYGDVHYNIYVPADYDYSRPYALFITLSGSDGLYAEGVGANLEFEEFGYTAQAYIPDMIVVAPQLEDWGSWAADQTIALIDELLATYNIDADRIFIEGYSYGGETMSCILEQRPGMFVRALHVSSQWDGNLAPVAEARLPIYFFVGEDDSYYGSQPAQDAYNELVRLYREQGLSDEEIAELAILDVRGAEYFDIFGVSDQHAVGVLAAEDPEAMDWLFGQ